MNFLRREFQKLRSLQTEATERIGTLYSRVHGNEDRVMLIK